MTDGLPDFVFCCACDKKLEYWDWSECYFIQDEDDQDWPFCKQHADEYYEQRNKLFKLFIKYPENIDKIL